MGRKDRSLEKEMNLQGDAVIGNQCGENSAWRFQEEGKDITYLNTDEVGVGKNRNKVLEHSTGDLCILADDDMRFVDGYPAIALRAFQECPKADILVFNLIEKEPARQVNHHYKRLDIFNYARYGAARIAFKRESVMQAQIRFSLLFGGGAKYGAGEDTIFLRDCLQKKLQVYAAPYALAHLDQGESSSWKAGHRKFFFDKGAAYACLHPSLYFVFDALFLARHWKEYPCELSAKDAFALMRRGSRDYKQHYG